MDRNSLTLNRFANLPTSAGAVTTTPIETATMESTGSNSATNGPFRPANGPPVYIGPSRRTNGMENKL